MLSSKEYHTPKECANVSVTIKTTEGFRRGSFYHLFNCFASVWPVLMISDGPWTLAMNYYDLNQMVFAAIVAAVIGYILFAGGNQNSSLDSASQL